MPSLPERINQPVRYSAPRQVNTDDCGVAVIVNGLYTLASRPLPPTTNCNYGIWHRVLAAMLIDQDEPDGNLSLVPPELAEEPIIDMGTVEPRPASLPASEYSDWVRTERQRSETHMRSTADSLVDFLSGCRSHQMLITEIVAVLESLALNPDNTLD
ncbi:Ulp1 protease family [Fusarium subglutinans]|uniref:Ulp1 protease family n=1 Tax=Gibberella subglutinans TaxID=42677 RepID=A0A8H5NU65_GIBSU|nr:Ulp1 protease family [Fusarium subglutinans]KAF5578872.1 Ulp1 protease family [Fusarium subglutinans]